MCQLQGGPMADGLWLPDSSSVEHGSAAAPAGLRDKLVNEHTVGGPLDPRDVRMVLDRATLEQLLAVACASLAGCAELHRVGLRVRTWQTGEGHRYQTLTLVSSPPRPARTPVG
jgi:hypothetical protein